MKILKIILIYLFAFFGSYILTAFCEADLNFINWTPEVRFTVIMFGFAPFFWLYNNKD